MSSVGGPPGPALVLIAEDEEPVAELLAYVVADAGYIPLLAPHGRAALELARARRPALLITDLMMPYLGGAALIATLRADAAAVGQTAVPAILVTGSGTRQALAAGADVILYKPFHIAAVEALLDRFLALASSGTESDGARE